MAEHDSDREDREDRERREDRDGRGHRDDRAGGRGREPEEQSVPFDEEAAWAAIVAGYGEEPADPPGAKPFKSVEDLALLEAEPNDDGSGPAVVGSGSSTGTGSADGPASGSGPGADSGAGSGTGPGADSGAGSEPGSGDEAEPVKPLGGSVSFAPGVGPRDYTPGKPSEADLDEDDEGHFVPPEPPPLPAADTTARFAWLGVVGGPVLLLLSVLLGWEMTWWLATVGIGGFLGGFATLVARMRTDDEDDGDPGSGAVV
ncbi:hypothetical protein [Streptomyces sp. NPDC003247]|uniref:hypothetical protein n=1 Tax=Streptomyces sp. NPDC003247 TaxID=3364677 RepID=UPI0036A229E7